MTARQVDDGGVAPMTPNNASTNGGDGNACQVASVFDAIAKPEADNREYRGLQLANGMKVLLISDSETDKSSAALDVHVGHLSDPWELPGLAHFCEHMLFLGTTKYPEENEYNKFLQVSRLIAT